MSREPIYEVLIIALAIAFAWVALSWASGGAVLAEERAKRAAVESVVETQATRIAILVRPTPTPACRWNC